MSRRPSRLGQAAVSVVAALLVAAVAACGDDPAGPVWEVIDEVSYADAFVTADDDTLTVDLAQMTETESGVWFEDLVVGAGDSAATGDTMFVSYNGWLRNGLLFDSGTGFSFTFFDDGAIGGFHYGTAGQQVGGSRLVLIPPEWGYGNLSVGPIYGGAVLVFEITLDSIHPDTTTS